MLKVAQLRKKTMGILQNDFLKNGQMTNLIFLKMGKGHFPFSDPSCRALKLVRPGHWCYFMLLNILLFAMINQDQRHFSPDIDISKHKGYW